MKIPIPKKREHKRYLHWAYISVLLIFLFLDGIYSTSAVDVVTFNRQLLGDVDDMRDAYRIFRDTKNDLNGLAIDANTLYANSLLECPMAGAMEEEMNFYSANVTSASRAIGNAYSWIDTMSEEFNFSGFWNDVREIVVFGAISIFLGVSMLVFYLHRCPIGVRVTTLVFCWFIAAAQAFAAGTLITLVAMADFCMDPWESTKLFFTKQDQLMIDTLTYWQNCNGENPMEDALVGVTRSSISLISTIDALLGTIGACSGDSDLLALRNTLTQSILSSDMSISNSDCHHIHLLWDRVTIDSICVGTFDGSTDAWMGLEIFCLIGSIIVVMSDVVYRTLQQEQREWASGGGDRYLGTRRRNEERAAFGESVAQGVQIGEDGVHEESYDGQYSEQCEYDDIHVRPSTKMVTGDNYGAESYTFEHVQDTCIESSAVCEPDGPDKASILGEEAHNPELCEPCDEDKSMSLELVRQKICKPNE